MKGKAAVTNIKRLLFAKQSMMVAIVGCESALRRELTASERTIYSAGIAATYGSSFTDANGLGKLQKDFEAFPNKSLKDSHDSALKCRHELFAHRDMRATGTNKFGKPVVLHRVWVEIDPSGYPELVTTDIKWKDSVFELMGQLCQFQLNRLDQEFKKAFAEMHSGTKKAPGRYELGVDYP